MLDDKNISGQSLSAPPLSLGQERKGGKKKEERRISQNRLGQYDPHHNMTSRTAPPPHPPHPHSQRERQVVRVGVCDRDLWTTRVHCRASRDTQHVTRDLAPRVRPTCCRIPPSFLQHKQCSPRFFSPAPPRPTTPPPGLVCRSLQTI